MVEIPPFQLGYGSGARTGIYENGEEGAVAQADDMRRVQGCEQLPCLIDGDLRRLAFHGRITLAADREGRVEHNGMTRHHAVEEMPQGGEMLVARGNARGFREVPLSQCTKTSLGA